VDSSTVRKREKIKRWRVPLFEKAEKSNGGESHCSKKVKNQTVDNTTTKKSAQAPIQHHSH
jgi:hypothetical protein